LFGCTIATSGKSTLAEVDGVGSQEAAQMERKDEKK
jgi:hypothetical protein